MIKAVLFDFGGVLTEGGKLGSIRGMFAMAYGVNPDEVRLSDAVQEAFRGTMSDEAFVNAINEANPQCQPATNSIFIDNADIFVRCDAVYALANQLRGQGIITGVFSNVFATSVEALRKDGFYDGFAPLFLSCEHHMMKPETPFYEYVIKELGLQPAEILFIDDKDEFLAPARELGMHTVRADSPAQIVKDTKALVAKERRVRL